MAWWFQQQARVRKTGSKSIAFACETLEGRTLMATSQMMAMLPTVTPEFAPLQISPGLAARVQQNNPALYQALETFLDDFTVAINAPTGLTGAATTLSDDVATIVVAAPSSTSLATTTLTTDVTTATTKGAVSTTSQTLSSDLTTVLTQAIAPSTSASTANASATASSVSPPKSTSTTALALTTVSDPNSLSTATSEADRGQSGGEADTPASTVDGLTIPAGPAKKAALGKLLGDLTTIFAKVNTLAPLQKADFRADLVAITAVSHRPSQQSVATLQSDITRITAAGAINAAGAATLSTDLTAVLQSAGVSSRLVTRTQQDLAPILASPDLAPTDVSAILNDLASVLLNLPAATTVPGGPASWFMGKNPLK